jgi:hypothetical protein
MRQARLVSLVLMMGVSLAAPALLAQTKARAPATQKAKPAAAADEKAPEEKADDATPVAGDSDVKAAGTAAATKEAKAEKAVKANVVEESADKEGVKTYKFKAVEVEGRLKSPQIIYFLRRVRAEFDAGLLGHRSFMPELSDSRRNPALK